MSRLLLAKAARVCGWPPERWQDGWPDLLTARELAKLQGDPDVEAIMPPQGAGLLPERPRYAASRGGMFDPITGARGGYRLSDAPSMSPAYHAAMVRPLLAGVDLSPLLTDWLNAHAPEQAPALAESQGTHAHIQERAEHNPLPDPLNESWREDSAMELIERRMCAILWVIESKEFERMALENGDKGRIKELCEHSAPKLFEGSTVFDDAWKAGSKRQWWRMADYAKYMKNRGS